MEIIFQDKANNFTVAIANQADGCLGRRPLVKKEAINKARQQAWQTLGVKSAPFWLAPRGRRAVTLAANQAGGIYRGQSLLVKGPVALNLLVADCPALVLFTPAKKIIGLLHFGWRQALDGSLNNFLTAWQQAGGEWSQTQAVITPGICGRCYRLSGWRGYLRAAWYKIFGPADFLFDEPADYYLDLRGGLLKKISELGIKRENVFFSAVCTKENGEYYSHRRQGRKRLSNNLIIAYFG